MKCHLRAAKPAVLAFIPTWILSALLGLSWPILISETFAHLFIYMALFFLCGMLFSRYYARGKGAPGWEIGGISLLLLSDLFLRNGIERLTALAGDGHFGSYLAAVLEAVLRSLGYDTGMTRTWQDPRFYLLAIVIAALFAGIFVLGFHWKEFLPEKE